MDKPNISILGGGPAGLAVGYYARKSEIPFTIYEAKDRIGGNCVTLRHLDFLFDSGAHRFHDEIGEVTEEMRELMGDDLREIDVMSQIYHRGNFINFPLSPLNLLMKLGFSTFVRAAIEVLYSRLSIRDQNENFEDFALYTYGKTIAERFLLNYSQQLWGAPCRQLSVNIAGKRMRGLNLRTFITEAAFWQKGETKHLEGSTFYYPNRGIGTIMDKLGQFCGTENIALNSNITRILHDRSRILEVEVNGSKRIEVGEVVSTLPLNLLLRIMEPKPPEEIIELAQSVRYRHMVLIALFLNRDSVTKAATVYFPDSDCSFTRVCEPKNRNQYMSPPGKTSLVAEIPCQTDDEFWNMDDHELVDLVRSRLMHMNWIKEEEIIDTLVTRIPYSYPILEVGFEEKINEISRFLNSFPNLTISGRNGRFVYAWIHDMMQFGREIIEDYNTRA